MLEQITLFESGVTAIPPRPTITDEVIKEAAKKALKSVFSGNDLEMIANDIASEHYEGIDGYELAKNLDHLGWNINTDIVSACDDVDACAYGILNTLEKEWAKTYNVQPLLPVGQVLKRGVITGVSQHSGAKYLVKEHGDTREGRFLLINFEDAEKEVLEQNKNENHS